MFFSWHCFAVSLLFARPTATTYLQKKCSEGLLLLCRSMYRGLSLFAVDTFRQITTNNEEELPGGNFINILRAPFSQKILKMQFLAQMCLNCEISYNVIKVVKF